MPWIRLLVMLTSGSSCELGSPHRQTDNTCTRVEAGPCSVARPDGIGPAYRNRTIEGPLLIDTGTGIAIHRGIPSLDDGGTCVPYVEVRTEG